MKRIRKVIIVVLVLVVCFGVAAGVYFHEHPSIAVLGYHSFYDKDVESNDGNQFVMERGTFEKQMKYLHDNKFRTLSLDEFYCWKKGTCQFDNKTVLITMDDGYYSNYKYAFPILKKYGLHAVVFFIGGYTPKDDESYNADEIMSFETIEKTKEEYPSIEFASHSFDMHGKKNVTNMTKEEMEKDISEFEKISDTKYIAYPEGKYTSDFVDVLKKKKFHLAFGFGPVHKKATRDDDDYAVSRLSITDKMPFWKYKLRIMMPY